MEARQIARICHEANRAYCIELGDYSQPDWGQAPEWQVASAIDGVTFHLDNQGAGPAESHVNWLRVKEEEGWVYGEEKDEELKTHPCMVAYEDLPLAQRLKDSLFLFIVDVFRDSYFILLNETTSESEEE